MTEIKKEKKKLKSLIRFHSANKINNYKSGEKNEKKRKIQKNLQNKSNIRIINVLLESLLPRVLSFSGSHSPLHFPRMPSNTVLISGPALGAAQILIWSYSSVFLPPMYTTIGTSVFSFVGALKDLSCSP